MLLDVAKAFLHPMEKIPFSASVMLPPQDICGETVSFSEVILDGNYTMADETIRISGILSTTAYSKCAVCLADVSFPICIDFDETFKKGADPDTDDFFPYDGKSIDLDMPVLSCVLLSLPMRFICQDNCKGAGARLSDWDENNTVWAQDDVPETYRPFENLKKMLSDTSDQEIQN